MRRRLGGWRKPAPRGELPVLVHLGPVRILAAGQTLITVSWRGRSWRWPR